MLCFIFFFSISSSVSISRAATMCPGSPAPPKSVCVMDASGPLAHALVDRLLRRGYTVHAATYAHHDSAAVLTQLCAAAGQDRQHRLKLFRADPFDYHTIADAVRGCSGVFCIPHDHPTCDEVMVEMEVRAAHNVVEACAQTDTMQRVVFTSSVTAVVWNGHQHQHQHHTHTHNHTMQQQQQQQQQQVDEKSWSELTLCRKLKLWHAVAKTLSERTAWALAMDRGVDMVAINAGLLTGAGLTPTAAHPYLKGAPDMYQGGVLVTVDVGFLADAHVAVYESPTAHGRYLCFDHAVCRPEDAARLARMLNPDAAAAAAAHHGLQAIPQRIHSSKLNKLMLDHHHHMHTSQTLGL